MTKRLDLRAHLGRIMVILTGIVVLNVVFLLLVIGPRLAQVRTADEITAELAQAVEREQRRVRQWQERVDDLQRSREILRRFFQEDLSTKGERLVAVQREIYRIAQTFQVQAAQLKFTHESVKDSNFVLLGVNIPLSGGYNNLRQFINQVERSDLFLIIESVQLQEGERGGVLLNLNVRLTTYFADDDETGDLRYRTEG
jgi:Tfp pilus assembly protein PilO